jgi:amidophosphoribosyltransferase
MTDKLVEKCAVAAVWGDSHAAPMLKTMLEALQHRGQDATGIATYDAGITRRHADLGLVADAYDELTLNNLPGSVAIGHNRYATSSGVHELSHLQPFTTEASGWSLAHNGNLSVTTPLINFLIDKKIP